MWKKLPLLAAVLVLCACNSAPKVKFPSGSGSRIPINVATPYPSAVAQTIPGVKSKGGETPGVDEVPVAVPAKSFFVMEGDGTVMAVLARWTRAEGKEFVWRSDVDYAVNTKLRQVRASTLEQGAESLAAAMAGVVIPLAIDVGPTQVVVSRRGDVRAAAAPIATGGSSLITESTQGAESSAAALRRSTNTDNANTPSTAVETTNSPTLSAGAFAMAAEEALARRRAAATRSTWPTTSSTLKDMVQGWGRDIGVEVRWESASDYPVPASVKSARITGSFKDALGQLSAAYGEFKTPLGMKFLDGGRVLRVYDMSRAM
ncbi:MAG: hypothetical protein DI563_05775 [Variovorax paradoxus]|uniref:Toxin co-regulated pilus biosynthesis protein Q C-terminal domain-containing protein n=1 Tax=Variovorax paradoxus TaxID=34073 RepID=A0A2W5QPR2_VARPD|nr:MAG: hypothetical protein DI563_05775 [Variovorax paradoxus]